MSIVKQEDIMKKKTKIVCTMGPNTDNEETLRKLILAGMDIARFNFSHGSYDEQKRRMDMVKKLRKELKIPVAILLDTKGPEIRTGVLKEHKSVNIKDGAEFTFTTKIIEGDENKVSITYDHLTYELKTGDIILVDDGLMKFEVQKITDTDIICRTVHGGVLSERKGINLPGISVNLPAITEKDKEDLLFGIEQDVDFVAASFIRSADAVREIKSFLKDNGGGDIHVISKIENAQGIEKMDEIIEASDGIMVARGDMGVEIPAHKVPHIQKEMIRKCRDEFKPVITATQMLDSMIRNPGPTRAEVTDVANAILDGTDAIMLSGETAVGKFPVEAVKMMCEIAVETEQYFDYEKYASEMESHMKNDISNVVAYSSMHAAKSLKAKFIITPSISGFTAKIISKYRPQTPVIGMSPNERTLRRMQIYWGVYPLASTKIENEHALIERSINILKNLEYVKKDDTIVITAGVAPSEDMPEVSGNTNTMRVSLIN